MASQFFLYRYKFQPLAGNSRYTPSFEFLPKYPELTGFASLTDEIVSESKYKTLPNGQISGLRVGKLEWDSTALADFGYDEAAVVTELVDFGKDFAIKTKTNAELADFIRTYTDLDETEPGLFVLSEAHEKMGVTVDAKLLDLR